MGRHTDTLEVICTRARGCIWARLCVYLRGDPVHCLRNTSRCVMRVEAEVHLCVWGGGLMDGFGGSVGLCGIKLGGCACKISTNPVIIGRGANIRKRKEKKPLKKINIPSGLGLVNCKLTFFMKYRQGEF